MTQPLTPLHPPSRPPLGPPPVGGPPLIRPSTVTAGAPNTQSLLHSATNQEGKKQFALLLDLAAVPGPCRCSRSGCVELSIAWSS